MARVSVTTARRGAVRVAGVIVGGCLAVMMAGCSSNGTNLSDAAGETASLAPQAAVVTPSKPVTFAPVIGAPAKVSTKINELLVAQAGQKSVPVVPPKDAEYTIRGYLVASADPKGTKLSYIWDVSDKSNKRKRIQGEELIEGKKGGDPWTAVDDNAMQRVTAKAIDEIVAFLPKGEPKPAGTGAPVPGVASASTDKTKEGASANLTSAPTSSGGFSFNPLASLFGSSSSSSAPQTESSAPTALSSEPVTPPASSAPVKVASLNDEAPTRLTQPVAQSPSPSPAPQQRASTASGPVLAAQTSQPERSERAERPAREPRPERAAQPERAAPASEPAPAPVKVAAAAPAASSGDPVALVPSVSGAPGDGSTSLTAAMRKSLQSAGVKLTSQSSGANVYTVRGTVEMGEATDGQQPITIQWTVVDPAGKPMSQAVVQRNKVPAGSLDGPWGQIADMAAGEAAKSIAKLLVKPTG